MATITGIQVVIGANLNGFDRAISSVVGGLNSVASSVSKVASSVSSASSSAFAGFSSSLNRVGSSLTDLNRKIQDNKDNFKSLGDGIKGVGEGMTKYITAPLALVGGLALKTAGDMQALRKGLAAVLPAGADLNKELKQLREVAKLPGLGLKEALQGSINLQAAGFSAELARQSLTGFGKALATVGKGKADLDGVSQALSQMAAKGKISAEEIGQISGRVPQIRKVMMEAFGTADGQALEKMGVDVTTFVDTITKELNKLPNISGGINNAFENMGDSVTGALDILGTAINENFNIEGLLGRAADAITSVAESFRTMSPAAQKAILIVGGVAAAIGPLALGLGSVISILPVLSKGFMALSAVFSPLALKIGLIVGAVAALVLIVKSVYDAWQPIANFFSRIFNEVALSVAKGVLSIVNSFEGISSKVGITFDDTKASLNSFIAATQKDIDTTPYSTFTGAVMSVGQAMKNNVTGLFDFGGAAKTTSTDVKNLTSDLTDLNKNELTGEQKGILAELGKELGFAEEKAKAFGTESELAAAKIDILNGGINKLIETGLSAGSKTIGDLGKKIAELASGEKIKFSGIEAIKLDAEITQIGIDPSAVAGLTRAGSALDQVTSMGDKSRASFEALSNKIKISADGLQRLSIAGQSFSTYIDEGTKKAIDNMNKLSSVIQSSLQQGLASVAVYVGEFMGSLFTDDGGNKVIQKQAQTRIDALKQEIETARQLEEQYQKSQRTAQLNGETEAVQKFGEAAIAQTEKIEAFNQKLKEQQGILENAGGATNKFENFFQGLLGVVGGFLEQFGKALIAAGVASEAFQKLLVAGGGIVAIGAGIALIAASKVITNLLKKGPGGGAPALATGTNYIPSDGLYRLHQGEAVVPKKFNEKEFYGSSDIAVSVQLSGAEIGFDALTFGVEKAFGQRQRMKGY